MEFFLSKTQTKDGSALKKMSVTLLTNRLMVYQITVYKNSNGGDCFKNKKWSSRSNVLDNKNWSNGKRFSSSRNEINKRKKTGSAGLPELLCKCSLSGFPWGSRAGCSLLLRRGAARCGTQSSPPPTPRGRRI